MILYMTNNFRIIIKFCKRRTRVLFDFRIQNKNFAFWLSLKIKENSVLENSKIVWRLWCRKISYIHSILLFIGPVLHTDAKMWNFFAIPSPSLTLQFAYQIPLHSTYIEFDL